MSCNRVSGHYGVRPYLKPGISEVDADPTFREQFDGAVEESVVREERDRKK